MKNTLTLLLFFVSINLFGQVFETETYKSLREPRFKSDINIYYDKQMDDYNIHFVKLDLNVSDQSTYISGNATIYANVNTMLDTLIFDFSGYLTLDSMFINHNRVDALHSNNKIQYIFDSPLNQGDHIIAHVFYHGIPDPQGGGVTNDFDSQYGKSVTWTLSESFHAMEWWPCKQVLSDKIDSTYIFLTCDDDCMAGSNGLLNNVVNLPNQKRRFEWKSYYPINYYLISFAVSEYQDYSIYAQPDGSDPILIQNFVYNNSNYLASNQENIDNTIDLLELFSEKFGLYPFANEKYGHCLTTLGGGMEHQTMTTLGNFGFGLVAHELGHMWFGDYVTCATWQDIWINEGFASYTEYVAAENLLSKEEADGWMSYFHERALMEPYRGVYIPFESAFDEGRIFSSNLSYKKGATLLHMLRHEINNDELFFNSIQEYLVEYGDSVAKGEDYKNSMESSTSMEFDAFFDQWYYGKGFPRFDVDYTQINDTLYMTVTQTGSSSETPLFQVTVDYKLIYEGGDTTIKHFQSTNLEEFKIPFKKTIWEIQLDPENWILNQEGTINAIESSDYKHLIFDVYPNPASNKINIRFLNKLNNKQKEIQLLDINGRVLKSFTFKDDNYIMDVSNLPTGIYILCGSSLNNRYSYKLIKQ